MCKLITKATTKEVNDFTMEENLRFHRQAVRPQEIHTESSNQEGDQTALPVQQI